MNNTNTTEARSKANETRKKNLEPMFKLFALKRKKESLTVKMSILTSQVEEITNQMNSLLQEGGLIESPVRPVGAFSPRKTNLDKIKDALMSGGPSRTKDLVQQTQIAYSAVSMLLNSRPDIFKKTSNSWEINK